MTVHLEVTQNQWGTNRTQTSLADFFKGSHMGERSAFSERKKWKWMLKGRGIYQETKQKTSGTCHAVQKQSRLPAEPESHRLVPRSGQVECSEEPGQPGPRQFMLS